MEQITSKNTNLKSHHLIVFQVKLVQSKEGSHKAIFNLYKKYQMKIHNDPPEKLSSRSYERFLVNSPLQVNYTYHLLIIFSSLLFTLTRNPEDKISLG